MMILGNVGVCVAFPVFWKAGGNDGRTESTVFGVVSGV